MGNKYSAHEVAVVLANAFGDDCACNFNGNDEWLPMVCDFKDTVCPNPCGVACWEQYLKHNPELLKEKAMNKTLLPCPFCGGIGTLWSIDQCDTVYAVCQDCGARTVDYKHAEEAIAAWNRRTATDEQEGENHDG